MAGGRGTRLAPYTTVLPKPLMPLADRPIIDVMLRQLVRSGVREIEIMVGHLGGLIESWIRNEPDYGARIAFTYESEPLGTAGALGKLEGLTGPFLAANGDILTTLPFRELVDDHGRSDAIATMAVKDRAVDVEYGIVHTTGDGVVSRLEEKPTLRYTVSMGVYAFDASIVGYIEPGERIDFPDLLTRVMEDGRSVRAYPFTGYWRDIGNRDDYAAAIDDFAEDAARFLGDDAG